MNLNLRSLARSKTTAIVVASALGAVSGAAAGYTVATRKLEMKYRAIADEEVAATRQYYAAMQKPATPQEALAQLQEEGALPEGAEEALKEYQGLTIRPSESTSTDVAKESDDEDVEHHNIFDSKFQQVPEDEDGWDYDEQLALRAELVPGTPYIINEEEYLHNEPEYEQHALTYFAKDDVLVDESDMPVDEVERAVGEDNLTKFGFGSNNNTMVFIRNDRMEVDFEISKDEGSFASAIGFNDDELEHSAYRGVRKFKNHDD